MRNPVLPRPKTASSLRGGMILALASAIAAYLSVAHCGMRGIETFDMSIVADGGWRILNGQIPYQDFFMPIGPLVLYLQALAFRLAGGFSWQALIAHAAASNALASLLVFAILRPYVRTRDAFLCSLLTGGVFSLPLSFPWYDTTTWLILATALLAAEAAKTSAANARGLFAFLGGMLAALSLFSKINIGILGCAGIGAIILADNRREERSAFPFYLAGILAVSFAGTAWLQSRGDFLGSLLQTATGRHVSSRLQQTVLRLLWAYVPAEFANGRWIYNLSNLGMLLFSFWIVRLAAVRTTRPSVSFPLAARFLTVTFLQILAFITSGGHFSFYQPLLGLQLGYLLAFAQALKSPATPISIRVLKNPFFLGVTVILFYSFSGHLSWEFFPSMQVKTPCRTFTEAPFRGLTVREEVYRDFVEVLRWNKTVDPGDTLYIFPEAQLFYGALGRQSPRHIRLWYHDGLTYLENDPDTAAVVKLSPAYVLVRKYGRDYERPGDLARLHFARMPALEKFLRTRYSVEKELSSCTILKRNPG